MKFFKIFTFAWIATIFAGQAHAITNEELAKNFVQIPATQRMAVYWYWMSDNISVKGVEADLEAMKRAGISRAYIGNIWQDAVKPGNIKILTPEWWEVMDAALKKATELDIEIGIFNCPGWSQSGGPWISPQQSMRYLETNTVNVRGNGQLQHLTLPPLPPNGTDVKLLAFPAMESQSVMCELHKKTGSDLVQDIALPTDFVVRNVTFKTRDYLLADVLIQAETNGQFETIKTVHLDRTNTALNTGFRPFAPISIQVPDTKTARIRLVVKGGPRDCKFTAEIHSEPFVERYQEKSLAKMFQTPLPMWGEYMWPTSPEPADCPLVQPSQVYDITAMMRPDGTAEWTVPEGEWTLMRCSMVPTGVTNAPASPEATGLEVDKMSKKHVAAHFDAYMGELLRRIPESHRKSLKVVVQDSYETGGQNWTDDFIERFIETYHYDPIPFIPVLSGRVIGSQDQSERFLWDLRRLVADRVAYDYVGGLREISHQYGLTTWLENYGHWGFPSEFLMYGGQSDEVSGEFWSEGSLGDIENRAASSCAHIYGKERVWAESCTSGGPNFHRYPAVMKQRTDRFFCEGINATLLHLFVQQPDDSTLPGISAPFGNDFQRKNTWFGQMDLFTDYLRRCNMMLQQGRYIADVAYFIGEDAPKMTGETTPPLPKGYSFDYLNAEVLLRSTVQEGKLCLPSGMQYSVLVLPDQRTMRPNVIRHVAELVRDGLTVLGPRPQASPSMENYPYADREVDSIASLLWDKNEIGKGQLYPEGTDLKEILEGLGLFPDCYASEEDKYLFIHRQTSEADIYFVSNQSNEAQELHTTFRISGKEAEIWNPVTGERLRISQFADNGKATSTTLNLDSHESVFVIFKSHADQALHELVPLTDGSLGAQWGTAWQVSFDQKMRGPAEVQQMQTLASWTESRNDSVKYYSGTAFYENTLRLKKLPKTPLYLDLGKVMVMARVYINGQYAGGVWTNPYRLNVTPFLKKGKNTVKIEVVNNWQNRLIGDQFLPEDERPTWTSVNHWNSSSELQASGLLGPVRLLMAE